MVAFRFALFALAVAAFGQEPRLTPGVSTMHPILAIGSPAPDFELPGIDGKRHKLSEYQDPILVVMFICDHCPTSQLYEGRMKKLVDDYRSKGVGFVAIQPNDPRAILLSELGYTDVSDSLEEMKIRAEYRHFNFPYLYDGETQSAARGLPFTMVIAPGGKVLFQQQGEVDIVALRRVILANLENETYVGHPAYWAAR